MRYDLRDAGGLIDFVLKGFLSDPSNLDLMQAFTRRSYFSDETRHLDYLHQRSDTILSPSPVQLQSALATLAAFVTYTTYPVPEKACRPQSRSEHQSDPYYQCESLQGLQRPRLYIELPFAQGVGVLHDPAQHA